MESDPTWYRETFPDPSASSLLVFVLTGTDGARVEYTVEIVTSDDTLPFEQWH